MAQLAEIVAEMPAKSRQPFVDTVNALASGSTTLAEFAALVGAETIKAMVLDDSHAVTIAWRELSREVDGLLVASAGQPPYGRS